MKMKQYMIKLAQEFIIKDKHVKQALFGNSNIGALFAPKPQLTDKRLIDFLNQRNPGLGTALSSGKPLTIIPDEKLMGMQMDKQLKNQISQMTGGRPVSKRQIEIGKKVNEFLGSPTPKEAFNIGRAHENEHLRSFKANPNRRIFNPEKGGVRRMGSILAEEGRAYTKGISAPNLRKRTRVGQVQMLPYNMFMSARQASKGGSIRKELMSGKAGDLARKILRKGK